MRKMILFFQLCIILLLLSGCWSLREPERMLYAHGVGIDYKDNEYVVYVQIVNFANVAKSENPPGELQNVEVGVARGKTIEDAIVKLYTSVDEEIFWGHLSFIVFSEEALKDKRFNPIIDGFIRYVETRYRIWIFATKDDVKELLLTIPIINRSVNLSRLGDPMNSYRQESFMEPIDIRKLIIGLNEPNHEVTIPLVGVTERWVYDKENAKNVMVLGGGIVTPSQFKGFMIGEEIVGLQWMTNSTRQAELSFLLDENNKDSYTSVIINDMKVDIHPIAEKDGLKFDIDISVTALANIIPYKIKADILKEKTVQSIKEQVNNTYKKALDRDIDIYRLSEHAYRKKNKEWKKLQKNGKIELDEHSIRSVQVDIRRLNTGRKLLIDTIN